LADLCFRVAGINHMAWFTELSRSGEDLYPRLRACLDDAEAFSRDPVRFEIMRRFGYFVTESSPHMAEYVPYFLKSPEEMARLRLQSRTGEMNRHAYADLSRQRDEALRDLEAGHTELIRSNEYAALILQAMETGAPCLVHGNVTNTGLVDNLPEGCCVEVPCTVDGTGVHPSRVGALPPQCAALCRGNTAVQELTVRAVLEGRLDHVYHAAMLDPNTASQLSLSQVRETVDRLLEAQRDLIPILQM
jgi:alpha-galactosidase